jgi:CBS domain-containing protein
METMEHASSPSLSPPPTQHVYRGRGRYSVRVPACDLDDGDALQLPTIADLLPVSRVMSREVVCAGDDLDIGPLMDLMISRHIGCVPVVDERGRPIGMVTKFDVVEQQLALHRGPTGPVALTAGDVMMPLALSLDEHATIAHAAAMMAIEDVHHIAIITGSGTLIGIVSTMDIVRWMAANDGMLDRERIAV